MHTECLFAKIMIHILKSTYQNKRNVGQVILLGMTIITTGSEVKFAILKLSSDCSNRQTSYDYVTSI